MSAEPSMVFTWRLLAWLIGQKQLITSPWPSICIDSPVSQTPGIQCSVRVLSHVSCQPAAMGRVAVNRCLANPHVASHVLGGCWCCAWCQDRKWIVDKTDHGSASLDVRASNLLKSRVVLFVKICQCWSSFLSWGVIRHPTEGQTNTL